MGDRSWGRNDWDGKDAEQKQESWGSKDSWRKSGTYDKWRKPAAWSDQGEKKEYRNRSKRSWGSDDWKKTETDDYAKRGKWDDAKNEAAPPTDDASDTKYDMGEYVSAVMSMIQADAQSPEGPEQSAGNIAPSAAGSVTPGTQSQTRVVTADSVEKQLQHEHLHKKQLEGLGKAKAMFSDGTNAPLRHAPRREPGTGRKLPAPMVPASPRPNWDNPKPGEISKDKTVGQIVDFDQWKRYRRRLADVKFLGGPTSAATQVSSTLAHPVLTTTRSALQMGADTPRLPGVEAPSLGVSSRAGDATPMVAPVGSLSGVLPAGAATPRLPTPRLPSGCGAGFETPLVAPASGHGQLPSGCGGAGFETPLVAAAGPFLQSRGVAGFETPLVAPAAQMSLPRGGAGFETPLVAPAAQLPLPRGVAGFETPLVAPAAKLPLPRGGCMTPVFATASDMTPMVAPAHRSGDMTPMLTPSQRHCGGMTPAVASGADTPMVAPYCAVK